MITFKEIKAHFQTLCKRFKQQMILILKYFIRHPFKLLLAIVALLVLILAVYAIEYFIAGQSFKQNNVSQPVQLAVEGHEKASVKIKKFAKKIALRHAEPEVKHHEPAEPKKVEDAVVAEVIEEPSEPIKYRVWEIKQPLPHAPTAENIESEVQKEDSAASEAEKIEEPVKAVIVTIEEEQPAQSEEIKVSEPVQEIEKPAATEEPVLETEDEEMPLLYRKVANLGLTYLDNPVLIEGDAVLYGANELYVQDTYLYLYGIYTDPIKYDVRDVTDYLRKIIGEEKLQCLIVAYTKEGVATGLCFKGDTNINQMLVDEHMAENIAL
ncbi:MAG: hypothetical protein IKR60_01810 [Alphaproteobacteria bacterium]|nr:hypothetical protein [Alphaproteobacteria bacterium]